MRRSVRKITEVCGTQEGHINYTWVSVLEYLVRSTILVLVLSLVMFGRARQSNTSTRYFNVDHPQAFPATARKPRDTEATMTLMLLSLLTVVAFAPSGK